MISGLKNTPNSLPWMALFSRNDARAKRLAEAALWSVGLLTMAAANPEAPPLIEACFFKAVGWSFCPGCGLGHAIGYLARGEIVRSFGSHPFAIFVVGVLLHRIVTLVKPKSKIGTHTGESVLNYV